jgi:hypothetical protein
MRGRPWTRVVLTLTLAGAATASAQSWSQSADLAAGGASGATKIDASYSPLLSLFDDRLTLGLGARFGVFLLGDNSFRPVDSGSSGDLALQAPVALSINAFVQARIRVIGGFELGGNIDVIGYGFGPTSSGANGAHAAHFNVLALGSGDRGQLDSEFFVGWRAEHWGVRAGLTHFRTEFVAEAGGGRFTRSFTGGFAAVEARF